MARLVDSRQAATAQEHGGQTEGHGGQGVGRSGGGRRRRHSRLSCLSRGRVGAMDGFALLISRSARFSTLKFLMARVTRAPISA